MSLFDFKQKSDTDEKIKQTEQEITKAQEFFKNRFNIDPAQAPAELKRLQEEIRIKRDELQAKQILGQAIRKKQETIELEYHTQKLLNESRPDHQQINRLLEKMNAMPESTREKLLRERNEHQLNTITDNNFQKAIDTLPPYEAHILTTIREQTKERERLKEMERAEKDRDHTFARSR